MKRRECLGIYEYLKRECKEDRARLSSVVLSDRNRGSCHKQTQEVLSIRKHFFYCEGYQALAEIAQRGSGVSLHRDTQKPSGHDIGQQALYVPA